LLLHTIEGSYESAIGAYNNGVGNPHATVSLDRDIYTQHVDLNKGSYALKNLAGGTETNRDNVIQVELEGFASEVPEWDTLKLAKLVSNVIEPILKAVPWIKHQFAPHWSRSYGEANSGGRRFNAAQWDAFSGILGHQHAPENLHWDPGGLDVATLEALLGWTDIGVEMAHLEKYRDPETGYEAVVFPINDDRAALAVREFHDPRGGGEPIAGLPYVIDSAVAARRIVKV
jgi:hypothetical protein